MEKSKKKCGGSFIQPVQKGQNGIERNHVMHSGTIAHLCEKDDHPDNEGCRCECEFVWAKNFKS